MQYVHQKIFLNFFQKSIDKWIYLMYNSLEEYTGDPRRKGEKTMKKYTVKFLAKGLGLTYERILGFNSLCYSLATFNLYSNAILLEGDKVIQAKGTYLGR